MILKLGAVALALLLARSAAAQEHSHAALSSDSAATRFVAEARAGTLRYRDRAVAIADGYRFVGPDLPAMGEHWLNIRRILADSVDAAHPSVLIYVESPDGPVLAGTAYTRLLVPGDAYPDFPAGVHAWHDHSGLLQDEALPMAHAGHASSASSTHTRLGIMHLWLGIENPAGVWTADNWALPFVRAGLQPPMQSDGAARALAIAADSGRYYLEVFEAVGRLDSTSAHGVEQALRSAAGDVSSLTSGTHEQLTSVDVAQLERTWSSLGHRLTGILSPDEKERLRPIFGMWWASMQQL